MAWTSFSMCLWWDQLFRTETCSFGIRTRCLVIPNSVDRSSIAWLSSSMMSLGFRPWFLHLMLSSCYASLIPQAFTGRIHWTHSIVSPNIHFIQLSGSKFPDLKFNVLCTSLLIRTVIIVSAASSFAHNAWSLTWTLQTAHNHNHFPDVAVLPDCLQFSQEIRCMSILSWFFMSSVRDRLLWVRRMPAVHGRFGGVF